MLAGLVKSPSSYAPTVGMDRAIARRNVVLQAMLDTGAIDRPTFTRARAVKPVLHDDLREDEPYGQYFKEHLRRELVDRFGWQRVYQGGLRVFSTIDLGMQQAAEAAVADGLKAVESRRRALAAARQKAGRARPAAPTSTRIRCRPRCSPWILTTVMCVRSSAAAISRRAPFNRAVQAERQPGSAFKPFVYAAALEAGFTPATLIDNLDAPIETLQGAWTPEDEHSSAAGDDVEDGAAHFQQPGGGAPAAGGRHRPNGAVRAHHGRRRRAERAFAGARVGRSHPPIVDGGIRHVCQPRAGAATARHPACRGQRRGRAVHREGSRRPTPSATTTAFLMTTMMADVINAGTGAEARRLGFTLPAAGKTGTTNDFHDAWFVGFTPKLATGVWVGFDRPRTILPNGFAGTIAVPVWAAFMKAATRGDKPEWLDAAHGRHDGEGLQSVGQARHGGLRGCRGGRRQTATLNGDRWFTPNISPRGRGPRHSAICTRRRVSLVRSPRFFTRVKSRTPPSAADAGLPPGSERPAAAVSASGPAATSTPDAIADRAAREAAPRVLVAYLRHRRPTTKTTDKANDKRQGQRPEVIPSLPRRFHAVSRGHRSP